MNLNHTDIRPAEVKRREAWFALARFASLFMREFRRPGRACGSAIALTLGYCLIVAPQVGVWAGEPESWTDPALSVRGELALWLDASRQQAAAEATGVTAPAPNLPLAVWLDGSGQKRHLLQRREEARPRFIATNQAAAVRFDGTDDALERAGIGSSLRGATFFLVAAPRSNVGFFRGLLAINGFGRRDYDSGLTIDLGPGASTAFDTLSVEGAGFGGARDLMEVSRPFGSFQIIETVIGEGPSGVSTTIGGSTTTRDRTAGPIAFDEITVGARFYSNDARPHFVQGFLQGDLAEILVFERVLSPTERESVRNYLSAKYANFDAKLAEAATGHALEQVKDVPPAQVLVPGFEVFELPIELTNINNLRYRPDGVLVALGYNGDIHLLRDTNGDGLEDKSSLFWESRGALRGPIGMALTPPGYAKGAGAFVPSKGKCSLIVDQNGDDVADQEITISTGWKEIPQAVDALGMAVGADGSLYFGLGTTDFSNGFLVDADGKGHYDITSERGTILKLSPDFQTRQIIATGIRFPVALAFNAHGDLFCTDQEGATWLPNGNPFDELLHIRSGRHYGFPPRHSRHLPNVIDEPSTFDYRPQHQSTCGLVFNIPANPGASTFGPDWWRDNAFVAGYSRGRIYRTELVKTRGEYVGRTSEFALFSMLVSEVCLAPDGSLVVAAHSGLPDWGTGPTGKGKLYKIRYTGRELAQPVMAWANGPREVRVAFDRELRIEDLPKLKEGLRIEFGSAVAAGDRFETLRPGYAVVAAQTAEPRHWLETRSFGVTPDRRTLVIGTDLQTRAQPHAITLGRPSVNGSTEHGTLSLPQHNTMDLGYGLAGAKVRWESHDGAESWEGWLPHLDLAIARRFTRGSSEHDRLWGLLTHPGVLVLQARLELASLLRPAVQPGSKVDDVLPPETAILSFRSARLSDVRASAGTLRMKSGDKGGEATLSVTDSKDGSPVDLLIQLDTGVGTPRAGDDSVGMDVDYRTNEDDRPRALPPHRILLPWSMENDAGTAVSVRSIPAELAGGNWARGREVFQSELALCSRCHAIRGQGGKIGPDLSNLVERDHASVLRDIREPSAALNPDYITHTVALEDGRVLTGTIRTEGDTLFVGDEKGEETAVPRTQVTELKPGAISTMPAGIVEKLGSDRLKDLLTYLLTSEPTPDSGR